MDAMTTTKRVRRVLVVDDDAPMRALERGCLEALGLQVEEAACGRTALAKLEAHPPSLVCLELTLPELSGYELCEYIHRSPALQDVPVMVVTARSHPVDRAYAEEAGAAKYLTKPFTAQHFTATVRELLGGDGGLP